MRNRGFITTALLLVFSAITGITAQAAEERAADVKVTADKVPAAAAAKPEMLNGPLGGIAPTGEVRGLSLSDPTLPDHEIVEEYGIRGIFERQYGRFQVRIFIAEYPAQAYGLYTYYRDPIATPTDFGTEGDLDVVEGLVQFWQGRRFVQVRDSEMASKGAGGSSQQLIKLARAVSEQLNALDLKGAAPEDLEEAKKLPGVVRHLPSGSLNLRTARYILGPRALAKLTGRDVSQYDFYPNSGTEVALSTYDQGDNKMNLIIVEYHTPQQAASAFKKLQDYRNALPAEEQAKRLLKREGNYIVEATDFKDAASAERTVGEVKYDYVVKWLDNLPIPGRDVATEAAKTAQMLVSVVGIIGITLSIALVMGIGTGLAIFYFRRRSTRNMEAFTDAGGMMRLNLDGLSLPELPAPRQERKLLDQ